VEEAGNGVIGGAGVACDVWVSSIESIYIYIYIKSLHHIIHHAIQCFEPGHVAFFSEI
jgi:hypothetical protein